MKLHFFHLMPCRFLPDNFAAKHRSVWADVDSELFDPARGHLIYNENLDESAYVSEDVQSKIAGSKVAILSECAHMPMIEQPDEFVSLVSDFLDD